MKLESGEKQPILRQTVGTQNETAKKFMTEMSFLGSIQR